MTGFSPFANWNLKADTAVGYSVRGAYDLLSNGDVSQIGIPFELV